MYICGHIHNFQHIRVPGSDIDYIVNSAGSLALQGENRLRELSSAAPNLASQSAPLINQELNLRMIDKKGNILYTVTRKK